YCGKLRDSGELPTAAGICERAHNLAPSDPRPLMALGEIFAQMDQLPRAVSAYLAVLEQSPQNVEARYVLGKTYIAMKRYDLALQELQFALTRNPEDARIYNALGIANGMLGNQVAARQAFEKGLTVAPDDIPLRNNLGLALVLEGKHEIGIAVLQAVALDPAANATTIRNLRLAESIAQTASNRQAVADASADESTSTPGAEQFASTETIPAEFGSDPEPNLSESQEVVSPANAAIPSQEPSRAALVAVPKEPVMLAGALSPSTDDTELAESGMPVYLDSAADTNEFVESVEAPEPDVQTAVALVDQDGGTDDSSNGLLNPASMPKPTLDPGYEAPAPTAELQSIVTADVNPAKPPMATPTGTQIAALGGENHYTVQLASYRSADRAQDGWRQIRASALDLLQDIDPVIRRSDLGPDKGVFFRLRTKASSKEAANQLCSALQARGLSCLTIKQEPAAAEETAIPTAAKS
ncbi:MAG: tetratricopeptide repeat protein, partial [Alphaproteobacteria bacterium]